MARWSPWCIVPVEEGLTVWAYRAGAGVFPAEHSWGTWRTLAYSPEDLTDDLPTHWMPMERPSAPPEAPVPLHLKTQRNQPYGSERRCCERCGIMLWDAECEHWTDQPDVYNDPPAGFTRCEVLRG